MYSDPDEERLLSLFAEHPESRISNQVMSILRDHPTWPLLIHLSPQRQLLLNWFEFKKNASLLEIGAGCGSLTGVYLKNCKHVTAIELSQKRAEVLRRRFCDFENLRVITNDIGQFKTTKRFDYVTMVGVLEYAGAFFEGGNENYTEEPFLGLLTRCRNLLKRNGTLILAIENQWGLKYLSGCSEDHYKSLFESINNYPHYHGVRTFGKNHLAQLLKRAGFKGNMQWYFPFPDYKFPLQVLSEEWLSQQNFGLSSIFPSSGGEQKRQHFFNEVLSADSLRQNQLLAEFANSFLVIVEAT